MTFCTCSVLQAVALNETECEWEQSRDDRVVPNEVVVTSLELAQEIETIKALTGFSDVHMNAATVGNNSKVCLGEKCVYLLQLWYSYQPTMLSMYLRFSALYFTFSL